MIIDFKEPDIETMNRAPILLRYGLWLTAAVYTLAALTLESAPLGPVLLFQVLYVSIAFSALMVWYRPDLEYARRYHVVVPTALIVVAGAEQTRQLLVLLDTTSALTTSDVLSVTTAFVSLLYIGVVQYVFLPLSILHKAGPT